MSTCAAAQVPSDAVVYLDTLAQFQGEPASLRVVFFEVRYQEGRDYYGVGVSVREPNGRELARATDDQAGLGLYEGTGVYDVTGDGWPEVVLIGIGGAKTVGTTIYHFQSRRLKEIGRWSGWRLKIVNLRGVPVVAYTPEQYGSLTELYVWKHGKFVDASNHFPEFYGPEVEQQAKILQSNTALPAYLFAQACELGARALVYGKNYGDAEILCQQALQIVRATSRVIPNTQGSTTQEFGRERKEAEEAIHETLKGIAHARAHNLSRLR